MRKVPCPRQPDERIVPLTPDEFALLIAQPERKTFAGSRDVAFMGLLGDTGLRVSEALGLRLADFVAGLLRSSREGRSPAYSEAAEGAFRRGIITEI